MTVLRIRFSLAAVVTAGALALTTCGDGATDAADSAQPAASTAADTRAADNTEPAAPVTSKKSSPSNGLTAPGTKLAYGESAVVPYDYAGKKGTVELTVLGVKKATAAQVKSLKVDAPGDGYFVNMRVRNLTAPTDAGNYMPSINDLRAMQNATKPARPVIAFTATPMCEDEDPSKLAKDKSFNTCRIFLADKGASIDHVGFAAEFDDDPIIWQ